MEGKKVNLGLGDAIIRLVKVQFQHHLRFGDTQEHNKEETKLLIQALNHIKLDLGFDCDGDGIIDTEEDFVDIDIFNLSAKTSCCRIMDDNSPPKGDIDFPMAEHAVEIPTKNTKKKIRKKKIRR